MLRPSVSKSKQAYPKITDCGCLILYTAGRSFGASVVKKVENNGCFMLHVMFKRFTDVIELLRRFLSYETTHRELHA